MPQDLFDRVTHWVATPTGYGGYTFALPTRQDGRWEDRVEKFMSDDGNEKVSRSIVYLSVDVLPEDYIMLGETLEADPTNLTGNKKAWQVQRFDKIADVRNTCYERKAFL